MQRLTAFACGLATCARNHPRWAAFLGALLLALPLGLFVDRPLSTAFHDGLSPELHGFFRVVTDIGLGGPWFALAIGGWVWCRFGASLALTVDGFRRWRLRARSWLFLLASLVAGGVAVHVLKFIFGRPRPGKWFEQGLYGLEPFSGNNSFPSGHSQLIFTVATALWFVYPRLRPVYIPLAVMIAFSRVAITQHYLSDIIMGGTLGVIVVLWVRDRFEADGKPSVRLR